MAETHTIVEVVDSNFQQIVLESDVPVVVDFWAPWCGPCRIVSPIVEELSHDYEGKVRFVKMNTDENEDAPMQFGIQVLPTLVIFSGGREVNRLIGFSPKEQLKRQIDRSLFA
jgi:thioredoxin 1